MSTRKSILVVDDSAVMRQLIEATLREGGYDVSVAGDTQAAMLIADEGPKDLVLTDWNMPGGGGLALIELLRRSPHFVSVPILVLTTESNDNSKHQARDAGASGWLSKPLDPSTLISVVDSLLKPSYRQMS